MKCNRFSTTLKASLFIIFFIFHFTPFCFECHASNVPDPFDTNDTCISNNNNQNLLTPDEIVDIINTTLSSHDAKVLNAEELAAFYTDYLRSQKTTSNYVPLNIESKYEPQDISYLHKATPTRKTNSKESAQQLR